MRLITSSGIRRAAVRGVIYGREGSGKSTLCAEMPGALFLDVEGGTKQLPVRRVDQEYIPDWHTLLDTLDAIIEDPEGIRTVIIDTVDRAEALLIESTLENNKVNSIEEVGNGYGKGYTQVAERFSKEFIRRLDKLISMGVNVTLIGHARSVKFENPESAQFDKWELNLTKKVSPLVKEWSDYLCFINLEIKVVQESKNKFKAKGAVHRTMSFNPSPTFDAKNRYGLGEGIYPLSFEPLREIYEGNTPTVPEHTMLTVDSPHEGIVDDDSILEDPRDVLVRRLNENGVETIRFEAWLVATGRLAPGSHYQNLSGVMSASMLDNIDILLDQLKGE